jgi:hypothetical protein
MSTVRFALTSVLVALWLGTCCSVAHAKPAVSLSLPAEADAGVPASFSGKASRAVVGGRLVVQRQVRTARVWRTIRTLSGRSGAGKLPPFALASYRLRIANIGRAPRRKVAAEQRREAESVQATDFYDWPSSVEGPPAPSFDPSFYNERTDRQ